MAVSVVVFATGTSVAVAVAVAVISGTVLFVICMAATATDIPVAVATTLLFYLLLRFLPKLPSFLLSYNPLTTLTSTSTPHTLPSKTVYPTHYLTKTSTQN
jgi:hypothetical protein